MGFLCEKDTSVRLKLSLFQPFHSQDLISNSPHCLPYNSYYVSIENLVLDQLIIP